MLRIFNCLIKDIGFVNYSNLPRIIKSTHYISLDLTLFHLLTHLTKVFYIYWTPLELMTISDEKGVTIRRKIIELEQQGAGRFFGERSSEVDDFLRTKDGKGLISIVRLTVIHITSHRG